MPIIILGMVLWFFYETIKLALLHFCRKKANALTWQAYKLSDTSTHPPQYGKYLICRKDGKIHWETWNGSGWAYNHNEIRYWAIIIQPN